MADFTANTAQPCIYSRIFLPQMRGYFAAGLRIECHEPEQTHSTCFGAGANRNRFQLCGAKGESGGSLRTLRRACVRRQRPVWTVQAFSGQDAPMSALQVYRRRILHALLEMRAHVRARRRLPLIFARPLNF